MIEIDPCPRQGTPCNSVVMARTDPTEKDPSIYIDNAGGWPGVPEDRTITVAGPREAIRIVVGDVARADEYPERVVSHRYVEVVVVNDAEFG